VIDAAAGCRLSKRLPGVYYYVQRRCCACMASLVVILFPLPVPADNELSQHVKPIIRHLGVQESLMPRTNVGTSAIFTDPAGRSDPSCDCDYEEMHARNETRVPMRAGARTCVCSA
jgi:hypothetical protein